MKVLLTGGGTGGHITPLLAVAETLKTTDPSVDILYVGDRGTQFAGLTAQANSFDKRYRIFAGKFRRYHKESWLTRIFAVKTNLLNLRDALYVLVGIFQSIAILAKERPNVVLLKGGFVGVPVGLAAALLRIPFVTHDSDALPGMANRIVGRWARYYATGLPAENYKYPRNKTKFVGVLVSDEHGRVTPVQEKAFKKELELPEDSQMLFVTGGSLGAQVINKAMVAIAPRLLQAYPKLWIKHQAGKGKTGCYKGFTDERLEVMELVTPLYRYTGASDVVVTRAGANTLAELGVQGKASIIVPNPLLTGGHQLKNAQAIVAHNAAIVVDEAELTTADGTVLEHAIRQLLDSSKQRTALGDGLHAMTPQDATQKLSKLLLDIANKRAGE